MGTSPRRRKDSPSPSKDDRRSSLAAQHTRDAIVRYHETRERLAAARARAAAGKDDGSESWINLTQSDATEAESHLVRCILAWSPDLSSLRVDEADRQHLAARGVHCCGDLYLAVPNNLAETVPTGERHGDDGGLVLMDLVVIPTANVVDVDTINRPF